jgi:hypothetical protein
VAVILDLIVDGFPGHGGICDMDPVFVVSTSGSLRGLKPRQLRS